MSGGALAFLFVVDGKRLETQSILLSTSLRHHHPKAAIFAYVSDASAAGMDADLRDLFDRIGVQIRRLPGADGLWRNDYPHGNKLLALADARDVGHSVFLDTDMVACAPLDPADLPDERQIAVVPEGVASWGKEGDRWERAYAHFGLPLPTERVRLTRRRRIEFLPYFNAGFVGIREGVRVEGKSFGQLWLETASAFDFKARIGGKRPWLDQITLPITMKRFGFDHKVMPVEYNFSISDRAPEPDARPVFLHYHRARFLQVWPQWQAVLGTVLDAFPPDRHDAVKTMLTDSGFELAAQG